LILRQLFDTVTTSGEKRGGLRFLYVAKPTALLKPVLEQSAQPQFGSDVNCP
jgi:hypothetical protein